MAGRRRRSGCVTTRCTSRSSRSTARTTRSIWRSARARRTLAFLRENGFALVIVDEPQGFQSSVPQVWEVTNRDLASVRLHGRNGETWEKKGLKTSAERFNYLYSGDELRELAGPVREI